MHACILLCYSLLPLCLSRDAEPCERVKYGALNISLDPSGVGSAYQVFSQKLCISKQDNLLFTRPIMASTETPSLYLTMIASGKTVNICFYHIVHLT